ncbi:MAG: purine-nucleoside phosphorylase [Actinomycetota bacterium]
MTTREALPGPGDRLAEQAAAALRERVGLGAAFSPRVAIVTGSGLASVLARVEPAAEVAYADLPGFPEPTVPGHDGRVVAGSFAGVEVVAFVGRFHLYEGHPPAVPALLPRVAHALGADVLVLTAAVGAVSEGLAPGSVVVLRDHLNFLGVDPLAGWRSPEGGPAFVELAGVYDPELGASALEHATSRAVAVSYGVYAAVHGPSYETPAEGMFLRGAGADVVGMSVVPESVPAHALGMRVLGLACVTNAAGTAVDHADVVRVSEATGHTIAEILADVLPQLGG